MKVYDIALMLIRALVTLDIVREAVALVFSTPRLLRLVFETNASNVLLGAEEAFLFIQPFANIVVSIALIALAPRIARFAAKFADAHDAAAAFH